jgi:hypothetical protein
MMNKSEKSEIRNFQYRDTKHVWLRKVIKLRMRQTKKIY